MNQDRLKSAVDALAACPDKDAVADLLRRHGCRGWPGDICRCPVADYFHRVGGDNGATVGVGSASLNDGGRWRLSLAVRAFVRAFDIGEYAGLRADAEGR